MKKQATPEPEVRRWNSWLYARVPHRGWALLSRQIGKHHSYLHNMEERGCIHPPGTVEDIARLLSANVTEALLAAGYVPRLHEDKWASILCDIRSERLEPELCAALRGLQGLDADQLRDADAMLVGLARGFVLAREQRVQRRRAS